MDNKNELQSLLVDLVQTQKKNYKAFVKVFVITISLYTLLLIFMICGFYLYESQFEYAETFSYTEDIDQEVEGDNATINNVKGNQYNDDAIHNEGKGDWLWVMQDKGLPERLLWQEAEQGQVETVIKQINLKERQSVVRLVGGMYDSPHRHKT